MVIINNYDDDNDDNNNNNFDLTSGKYNIKHNDKNMTYNI